MTDDPTRMFHEDHERRQMNVFPHSGLLTFHVGDGRGEWQYVALNRAAVERLHLLTVAFLARDSPQEPPGG